MTTLIQLFAGQNIQQSHSEAMVPVNLNNVAAQIKSGSNGLADLCAQLRTIARIDKAAYSRNKIRLPFICCANFEGNIRHGKHFRFIESFILDFDHFDNEQQIREQILPAIKSDETLAMAFVSPSGKGLKLLFYLNSPITELKEYSSFYKNFVHAFANKYELQKNADFTTNDATRVCFLAHDSNMYYNDSAIPVNWQSYLPSAMALWQNVSEVKQDTVGSTDAIEQKECRSNVKIPPATYEQVVKRLNPKTVSRQTVPLVVPAILEQVAVQVQAAIAGAGWQLKDITNIQYGKKVAAAHGFIWAELNIFYGKKGFSIVRSPKTGTDVAFGSELEALIWKTLQTPCEADYGCYPDVIKPESL